MGWKTQSARGGLSGATPAGSSTRLIGFWTSERRTTLKLYMHSAQSLLRLSACGQDDGVRKPRKESLQVRLQKVVQWLAWNLTGLCTGREGHPECAALAQVRVHAVFSV